MDQNHPSAIEYAIALAVVNFYDIERSDNRLIITVNKEEKGG